MRVQTKTDSEEDTAVNNEKSRPNADTLVDASPRHISNAEFGKRLYRMMISRGWNQSDLARAANLTRDSVSTYIRGKTTPTRKSVEALALAFGIPAEQIFPNHLEAEIEAAPAALDIKVSPTEPTKAWLRVNQLVHLQTAIKVAELLQADK